MKVSCPTCSSTLSIDDKKIPATGARIKCPTCQNVFPVKPPAASSASGVVPLPGLSAAKPRPPQQDWEEQPTRAVPLPGAAGPTMGAPAPAVRQQWEEQPTRAVPLPGAAGPTMGAPAPAVRQQWEEQPTRAVPLPGIAAAPSSPTSWEDDPTRAVPAPIPGARTAVAPPSNARTGSSVAVPLPGISAAPARATEHADEPTRAMEAPPDPDAFEVDLGGGPTSSMPPARGAVPLPGAAQRAPAPAGKSIPLPGAAAAPPRAAPRVAPSSASIPLPGAAATVAVPAYEAPAYEAPAYDPPAYEAPSSYENSFEAPPETDSMEFDISSASGSVPLPGSAGTAAMPALGGEFDMGGDAPAQGGGFDLGEAPGGFDLGAPPAAARGSFDFGEPAPAPDSFEFNPPEAAAPGAFDFGAPPAPAEAAPGAFDFGQPAAAPGAFDFGAPAAPQDQGGGLEFDVAAPPAAASMGFGEVDLGGPAPAGGGGALEFDPTSAPAASGKDDLEADLSAPLPSARPSGPTDGLEMLSFIDDTAKEAGKPEEPTAVRRFHVKRRSGKVFGPFEEAVITKMLEEGQLLGNEEVSLDAESWHPVGSEPAFQAVIARLMDAPSRGSTQVNMPAVDEQKGPSMDRLKQLYEGRMAAVAVVQGKEAVPFKKRLPWIVGGVLLTLFLVTGITLGVATPYGVFGLKLLFPAKVREGTREFEYLQAARQGFLTDTWKSYNASKESALAALAIKEFPEARAVWCQSVFYLDRKYHKATQEEVAQATNELVNVKLLGEKHPEVLRTLASEALTRKAPDEALGYIADALARDSDNLDSLFLRAEANLQKRQTAQAKTEFEQIIKKDPKSARALHALGLLNRAQNETSEAAAHFTSAMAAAPEHVGSSVELAEIAIVLKKDVAAGTPLLEQALSDKLKPNLSAAELGKAQALKAETLVVNGKLQDAVPLFEAALAADKTNPFTQARLGRLYLELHDPDKAVLLFKSASTTAPENLEYVEGYLSALIAVGRMEEATQVVQSATARFPGNAMLSYLSARVSDALDNPKDAEEAYKRAIAAPEADNPDAYLYLARLYMRFRRYSEAKPQLEAGLVKAPNNAALRVGMGELAFFERDLVRAEAEFKRAIELNPASADASLGQSRVSLENGKYDLAEAQVDKALELNPRITGGKLQRGITLWKLGRLEEALKVLDAAHADDPRNSQITVTLGAVAFDKGDLAKALEYLNAADQSNPDGNYYRARVNNLQRNHTQAIEAMKRALDFNGKNPLYRYWMGRILNDARKTDDAIAEWKLALEIDPNYADALEAMGRAYFERNDFKRAVKSYEDALKADPGRSTVRAAIGDAQMKQEDWDGAIASYNRALEADPDLKAAWYQLGLAWEEKKQVKKAIESYQRATQADDKNADPWRQLGWLYKSSNKKKEARAAFSKYLELKPEAEDKKQIEDEIAYDQ